MATPTSPGYAALISSHHQLSGIALILALNPVLVQAQSAIGNAQKIVRTVNGVLQTTTRQLGAADDVFSNERIDTGRQSAARLTFLDGTRLSIGANSNVTLDQFVFDLDPNKSSVAMSIAVGTLRFVSGNLPKSRYLIKTPTATIGVRGTIIEVIVAPDGTTTVNVIEGSATVTSQGVTTTVNAGFTVAVPPGGAPGAPTPSPASPSSVVAMNQSLGPEPGTAAGAPATEAASGGLTTGQLALGGVAAILLGAVVIAVSDDDDDEVSTSTSTSTATSTSP